VMGSEYLRLGGSGGPEIHFSGLPPAFYGCRDGGGHLEAVGFGSHGALLIYSCPVSLRDVWTSLEHRPGLGWCRR
jgi:hypothetical protein